MMLQQRRKLFLLVFLFSFLCLVILETSLFSSPTAVLSSKFYPSPVDGEQDTGGGLSAHLRARSAGQTPSSNSQASGQQYQSQSVSPPSSEASSEITTFELAAPNIPGANISHFHYDSISSSPSIPMPPADHDSSKPDAKQTHRKVNNNEPQPQSQTLHPSKPQPSIVGSECQYDYPSLFDLQFNNIHWQKFVSKNYPTAAATGTTTVNVTSTTTSSSSKNSQSNSSQQSQLWSHNGKQRSSATSSKSNYYLYNAYYDDRWRAGPASVRILAMIDRIHPPPTNCLLWSSKLRNPSNQRQKPLVTRATFVYAWYPKWGNYKDGILQPWVVTCPIPQPHQGLVPDSVSLVEVPPEIEPEYFDESSAATNDLDESDFLSPPQTRRRRDLDNPQASIAMPPAFSSSSLSPNIVIANNHQSPTSSGAQYHRDASSKRARYDCPKTLPITNNMPVYNQRPAEKKKFAVCVKGLDFPHDDVSVRLVEWIELLNLLGANKIFLYDLNVHENISKVLHYYQERGIVELSPLTLPGNQPNLPEYQHLYLKNKLTAKRQNELIPYNDCLYRNLNSYQYLALLDIDEIIMPLKHRNWHDLMEEVEQLSLSEQNYSRASYNVRNVYFFDDLAGPLGTTSTSSSSLSTSSSSEPRTSDDNEDRTLQAQVNREDSKVSHELESGIPSYLHMMQHVYRSKNYTEPGQYVKCFHNTDRVVSLHNHFPMNCFGQCTTYSIPTRLAHLQHYRKDCVGPLRQSCKNEFRAFTMRDTTIWKYKQQMIRRTTRVLNHLNIINHQKTMGTT